MNVVRGLAMDFAYNKVSRVESADRAKRTVLNAGR
jgi:hypothetical protein